MSRTSTTRLGAFALSFLLVGFLVVTGSRAAFTDTTSNDGNSWAAGTVSLTDDAASVMFNAADLKPGDTLENCIVVTYGGSLDADVTLYSESLTGDLGTYLDLEIQIGTGGSFDDTATADGQNAASCTGFTADSTIYPAGTVAGFAGASDDFASGVGTWGPSTGESMTYRFEVTVQDNDLAQGDIASLNFVWEAQNQ